MTRLDVVKVFIASPGDVAEERKLFPEAVQRVNQNKAKSMGYLLEPIGFEDALPGGGRPQEIINKDVEECDVFVLLFWKKWGSPSGKYSSGTEEEFSIAHRRFRKDKVPHLLIYFRDPPSEMMADPGPQLKKVITFRVEIERAKVYLYKPYSSPQEWREHLENHLSRWLDMHHGKLTGAAAATSIISPPPTGSDQSGSEDLRKQIQHMEELQKVLEGKVETAQTKLRTEAVGYAVEAMKLLEKGELTLAEGKFTKAISLYEEPEVMNNFGFFLWQIGSLDRAREMFERVLSLESGDKKQMHEAIAYNRLGNVYMTKGDWQQARKLYEKALEINTKLKRREGEADVYVSLGNVSLIQGHPKKAEGLYNEALAINTALGRDDGIADAYLSLGNVHRRKDELLKAKEMYEKALEINAKLHRTERMGTSYGNLGIVYRRQHDLTKAERMHKKALKINIALGLKENISDDYASLGNVYIMKKNLAKAEQMYRKALEIDTALGRKEGIALNHNNLGEVYAVRKQLKAASQMWTEAARLYKELGNLEMARAITSQMRARMKTSTKKSATKRSKPAVKKR